MVVVAHSLPVLAAESAHAQILRRYLRLIMPIDPVWKPLLSQ
jgi:hypothetical protein